MYLRVIYIRLKLNVHSTVPSTVQFVRTQSVHCLTVKDCTVGMNIQDRFSFRFRYQIKKKLDPVPAGSKNFGIFLLQDLVRLQFRYRIHENRKILFRPDPKILNLAHPYCTVDTPYFCIVECTLNVVFLK